MIAALGRINLLRKLLLAALKFLSPARAWNSVDGLLDATPWRNQLQGPSLATLWRVRGGIILLEAINVLSQGSQVLLYPT